MVSTTTNCHGVAAIDFATVSGCDKLAVDPKVTRGGTHDLLMTDVPDLVRIAVVAPIGNSDITPLCRQSFRWLWLFQTLSADNPVEDLNEHLFLLGGRFVPTKVIRVRNKGHVFGLMQETQLRWTRDRSPVNLEEFVHCQVRANETHSEAKRQFSVRNRDVHMNVQSPLSGGPLLSLLCSA